MSDSLEKLTVVGQTSGDFVGTDNSSIQNAIDSCNERGGGTVEVGPGTYQMNDSIHLKSGVKVRGAGEETVLRKSVMVKSGLSADLGYGHFDISLAEPEKFKAGMGVHVQDDNSGGFYTTVATLTWQDGDRFGSSRFMNHDYSRERNTVVRSVFPVVSGYHLEDASIENLTIDGNRDENEYLNGCRGGGIFLLQASNVAIRNVTIRDYNGDGISFQQTRDVLIEDCLYENNSGHGLHPGSGSVRPVMRRVRCLNNTHDGIFYCLRVSFSLTEDCHLEGNGRYGISVGGRDTDHLIRNNTIMSNGMNGLYFRIADEAMGGHRCHFEGNTLFENCTNEGYGEIFIDGETQDIHLLNNRITARAWAGDRPAIGIVVGEEASRIVAYGNEIEPSDALHLDNRGEPDSVSTDAPGEALAVGPDAAPADAGRHLVGSFEG